MLCGLSLAVGTVESPVVFTQGGGLGAQNIELFRFLLERLSSIIPGLLGRRLFPLLLRQLLVARELEGNIPDLCRKLPQRGVRFRVRLHSLLRGLYCVTVGSKLPIQCLELGPRGGECRPGLLHLVHHGLCPVHGLLGQCPSSLARLDLRALCLQFRKGGLHPLKLREPGIVGLGRALLRVERRDLSVQLTPRGFKLPKALRLLFDERCQVFEKLRVPRLIVLQIPLRRLEDVLHQGAQLFTLPKAAAFQLIPRAGEQILIPHVWRGVEEPAQDLVFLVTVGVEKFPELPLGQHDDLAKLLCVEPQQRLDTRRDLRRALRGLTVGFDKLCVRPRFVILIGAALFAEMQAALYLVFLAALGKAELHHRVLGLRHMVAVEHVGAAVAAAGGAVEGEHDGVKDGGLARTGVAGDEIEPVRELFKGQRGGPGVGAEGRHFQIQRSHLSASCFVR